MCSATVTTGGGSKKPSITVFGQAVHLAELKMPKGVESVQQVRGENAVVATVQVPRALVEAEPVAAAAVEGAAAEGAAAAPAAAPAGGDKKEPEKKEGDKKK